MAVEIGSLVVHGSFGGSDRGGDDAELPEAVAEALARLRRELIREMQAMLAEAGRRTRER